MPNSSDVTIRQPWPDEKPRLQDYLRAAFLYEADPSLLVVVKGRVERLVGAAALSFAPIQSVKTGWFSLRIEKSPDQAFITRELSKRILEMAWAAKCDRVFFGGTLDEKSEIAVTLQQLGFSIESVHEVFETNSSTMGPRLAKICDRLEASGLFPAGISLMTLQPRVVPEVREFLLRHIPQSVSSLALQSVAYKPEHSIALLLDGKIKGVLLCRRVEDVGHIGLRVVAPELRGGVGWANLLLLNTYISAGVKTGLRLTRFELNPDMHQDTRQLAETIEAQRRGRRLLLGITRQENN